MYVLILLFFLNLSLGAQDFFISDSLGTIKESSSSTEDAEWILSIEQKGLEEERILYKDQEAYKRWILKSYLEQGDYRTNEKYFFGESLRTETVLNGKDRIIEELLYDSQGSLLVKKKYDYDDAGKLLRIFSESDPQGTDYKLIYRDNGSLRKLSSDSNERIEWRAGDFDRQYIDSLFLIEGSISSRFSYDHGRVEKKIISSDQNVLEESLYNYSEDGTIENEVIYYSEQQRRTERFFDLEGRLQVENIYLEDVLESSLVNSYKDGFLVRRQERSSSIRDEWFYEYCDNAEEGDDPCLTRQYRNGLLLKKIEYFENEYIETLYRKNEPVLTRIIEDDGEGP